MKIGIINGPNLNLTGIREREIYGKESFLKILDNLELQFPGIVFHYYQSNLEGEIISKIQEWGFDFDGIVLNAGAYTHTSIAIGDAVKAVDSPVVEVHMSNIFSREEYRHTSYIAAAAKGVIAGFGMLSYELAVRSLVAENT